MSLNWRYTLCLFIYLKFVYTSNSHTSDDGHDSLEKHNSNIKKIGNHSNNNKINLNLIYKTLPLIFLPLYHVQSLCVIATISDTHLVCYVRLVLWFMYNIGNIHQQADILNVTSSA